MMIVLDPYDDISLHAFMEEDEAEMEFHWRKYIKYSPDEMTPFEMPRVKLYRVTGIKEVFPSSESYLDPLPF